MNFTVENGISSLSHESPLLFYQKSYATVQKYRKVLVFKVIDGLRLAVTIVFNIQEGRAKSLSKSPFGSFLLHRKTSTDTIKEFLVYIVDHLRRQGVKRVEIVHPPPIYEYFPAEEVFRFFHVCFEDLNQHIDLAQDFEAHLHPMQIRKLKAASKSGLDCREETPSELPAVHDFIAKSRRQNGLEINIALEKLTELFARFPDVYRIFSVFLKGARISTAITCQVTSNVAYYYLPATDEDHKSSSPMVPLMKHIATNYASQGVRILDLGIASVEGQKQEGLFTFKERMGAQVSLKRTYELQL